jgi:hypothetical protein
MRRATPVIMLIALAVAVAGCGSSHAASGAQSAPTTAPSPAAAAAATPHNADEISSSTRMICADDAKDDLAATLGVDTVAPVTPTWHNHLYSCAYKYTDGSFTLSVEQLSDAASTTRYFTQTGTRLGRVKTLSGLGQGAFTTKDGSVVVKKDDKVLVVDVRRLPARFGVPTDSPANVAISVAATIMGCWTGA